MEDPRWVRIIAVGLVLAALSIGYFLLSGSFVKSKPKTALAPVVDSAVAVASPSLRPATPSAYSRIVARNQTVVQTLPATGFPVALIGIFSASAMISGWGLRKFPK